MSQADRFPDCQVPEDLQERARVRGLVRFPDGRWWDPTDAVSMHVWTLDGRRWHWGTEWVDRDDMGPSLDSEAAALKAALDWLDWTEPGPLDDLLEEYGDKGVPAVRRWALKHLEHLPWVRKAGPWVDLRQPTDGPGFFPTSGDEDWGRVDQDRQRLVSHVWRIGTRWLTARRELRMSPQVIECATRDEAMGRSDGWAEEEGWLFDPKLPGEEAPPARVAVRENPGTRTYSEHAWPRLAPTKPGSRQTCPRCGVVRERTPGGRWRYFRDGQTQQAQRAQPICRLVQHAGRKRGNHTWRGVRAGLARCAGCQLWRYGGPILHRGYRYWRADSLEEALQIFEDEGGERSPGQCQPREER